MKRYEFWRIALLLLCLGLPAPARAQDPGTMCSDGRLGPVACIRPAHVAFDICQHIAQASRRHVLDPGFFARLIWQESRFDANALSPAGAQGIAQFMPGTAKLRGFTDAYNPAQALERSAHYLADLTQRFGNFGLAAVAYNGGERRAEGFLQGKGLATETINYVRIITGLNAEDWRDTPPKAHDFRLDKAKPFMPACLEMARARKVSSLGPPPARWKTWGVQIGFGVTKQEARNRVERLTRSCSAQISREKIQYIPVPSRIKRRAPYFMARIGRQSRNDAVSLCRSLSQSGCVCQVYRNPA